MYSIVITGPIGAGKSTQCKMIMEKLGAGAVFIPEFLDDPDKDRAQQAKQNLESWIEGKLPFLEFQKYISECQDRILSGVSPSNAGEGSVVRVMERLPSDCAIFAKASPTSKESDRAQILEWSRAIEEKHSLKYHPGAGFAFSVIRGDEDAKVTHSKILSIVNQDLDERETLSKEERVNMRIIRLCPSYGACVQRVIDRNRLSEKEYTIGYLGRVVELYENYERGIVN